MVETCFPTQHVLLFSTIPILFTFPSSSSAPWVDPDYVSYYWPWVGLITLKGKIYSWIGGIDHSYGLN